MHFIKLSTQQGANRWRIHELDAYTRGVHTSAIPRILYNPRQNRLTGNFDRIWFPYYKVWPWVNFQGQKSRSYKIHISNIIFHCKIYLWQSEVFATNRTKDMAKYVNLTFCVTLALTLTLIFQCKHSFRNFNKLNFSEKFDLGANFSRSRSKVKFKVIQGVSFHKL